MHVLAPGLHFFWEELQPRAGGHPHLSVAHMSLVVVLLSEMTEDNIVCIDIITPPLVGTKNQGKC